MAKQVAPTKVVGGGGFDFEDKVSAFFMCYLLLARPPLNPSFGIITRIDFYVRADGWLLDDLLLSLKHDKEEEKRSCAFSIKSSPQFSKSAAPSEFVRNAWDQYLGESSSVFKKETGRIGLITSPLDTDTKTKLEDLLKKARSQGPQDLLQRIQVGGYISKEGKSIFESFSCPQELAEKYSVNGQNTGELLRCIEHLQFDFEHTSSARLNEAISLLRDTLKSNSLEEAEALWETLCGIAREKRLQGGYIDLDTLIGSLRKKYKLKDFPEHSAIWENIERKTKEELDLIPDKIAGTVSIDRSSEISEIIDILKESNIVVLLGESGCGKTVIEKTFAVMHHESSKVVWVNTENLPFIIDLPSLEIFKVIPDDSAFLIIDGLDRFYDHSQFKKIALLLKACHQDSEHLPWKIIISCQPQEWERVQISLSGLNTEVDWKTFNVKNPLYDKFEPLWQKYPSLRSLSLHLHLQQFVFKPKVLDLIAKRISAGGSVDLQGWVGESNLISWYWEEEIGTNLDGLRRGVILKTIAARLADNLTIEVSATDFSTDELSIIQELIRDRILKNRNDRISFEHDLVADWTRQRILLEKYPMVFEYIKDRLTSPMWCRALRLLGIHLLESETDLQKWKDLFDSFGKEEDRGNLGQDLLLEASIFSGNPSANLQRQWIELEKNSGVLLRRLLNRFFYSASFPNQLALLITSQYKDEATAELITRYRDPYWLYWVPLIKFLSSHKADVIRLAQKQVTEIVDKWLRFSKLDWPTRSEAAELAIEIAEDMLALKMSKIPLLDEGGLVKLAFRAGLAACNEQPERVIDFALTACSRTVPSGRILELIGKYNEEVESREKGVERPKPKIPEDVFYPTFESEKPPPWPDGPMYRVNHDFHELCLESDSDIDALYPLILSHPDKAREIILALLIEHPTPRSIDSHPLEEYTGMEDVFRWFPPFYTRGPFYFFLNVRPQQGLDLLISLINFATERWAEQWISEGKEPPHIEIEFSWGKKRFIGDKYVYYWHRYIGHVSKIIPSALMALEQWLYGKLENEEHKGEADQCIRQILEKSSSLAFVGLLISVGKKNQKLFVDYLLPLLAIPEFYSWDVEHIISSEGHQMIGWFDLDRSMMKLAQKFNSMPHRKVELNKIAINVFINNKKTRKKFEVFRKKWKSRYEKALFATVSSDTLENLIQWFDISNWKKKKDPEHGEIFEFEMPKEIMERRKEDSKRIQDRQLLIYSPIKFRRILDSDEKLSSDDGEMIWGTIGVINNIELPNDDPDFDELNRKENAICGGLAVLFKYFKDWLKQKPDVEQWCIEKITGLILNPPLDRSFDSDVSMASWFWDRFCAEIMPMIWADDPDNRLFRRCMLILTINKHYETVSILFRSASELRGTLKEHFRQLTVFLLMWSHARWKHSRERHLEDKTFDVNKWLKKEIDTFVKGNVSNEPLTWGKIAQDEIERRKTFYEKESKKRGDRWKPPKEVYFDFWLIKAAFNWMPSLDQAVDKNERAEWVHFWKQALAWTLNMLETNDRGEISGTPTDWERWLFERIAIQVISMDSSEKPDELWRPILALGGEGHYWVDDFLMEWFMKGIGSETVPDNFIRRWKEMLEYAFKSEKWTSSRGYSRYYINNLWCALLGMNYRLSKLWVDNKKSIIKEMKQYYERWARDNLAVPESAVKFIYFLICPAAEEVLDNGLIWLDNASGKAGSEFFTDRHGDVQKPLADLLEVTLKKHKERLKQNNAAFGAFKSLLRKLVDLQNLQAIEIQQNLL